MEQPVKIGKSELWLGDCREILPTLGKIGAVVTDPPYGMTSHDWDIEIDPIAWMVAKSAICFSAEPFTQRLIKSATIPFKYDLIWVKNTATNLLNCKIRPARSHEQILVFGTPDYFPQMRKRSKLELARLNAEQRLRMQFANPSSVLFFDAVNNRNSEREDHPSQKPVDLLVWLLRSYTNTADTILDPFMGSGTTGVAAVQMGRRFIGIEREERYFEIACKRIEDAQRQGDLFIDAAA